VRTGERTPVDVAEVLRSSARLISHQKRGGSIKIDVDANDALPTVNADAGQIQQAVIALGTNAIDAMPEGGELAFRAYVRANSIIIEIEDSGVGIEPDHLSKVFEPFFTTKEVGHGTGPRAGGLLRDHYRSRRPLKRSFKSRKRDGFFNPITLNMIAVDLSF